MDIELGWVRSEFRDWSGFKCKKTSVEILFFTLWASVETGILPIMGCTWNRGNPWLDKVKKSLHYVNG